MKNNDNMKVYMIFFCEGYYPSSGMGDFVDFANDYLGAMDVLYYAVHDFKKDGMGNLNDCRGEIFNVETGELWKYNVSNPNEIVLFETEKKSTSER
jgi:hypothetical protein